MQPDLGSNLCDHKYFNYPWAIDRNEGGDKRGMKNIRG